MQEVPENGSDVAHLETVHSPSLLSGIDLRYCKNKFFGKHKWEAQWEPLPEPDTHIAQMQLTHSYEVRYFVTLS